MLHLDGAWSFARYLLTEDYQSGQLDRTAGFIKGIQHFAFDDVIVMNIVYEEAEGYFRGTEGHGERGRRAPEQSRLVPAGADEIDQRHRGVEIEG